MRSFFIPTTSKLQPRQILWLKLEQVQEKTVLHRLTWLLPQFPTITETPETPKYFSYRVLILCIVFAWSHVQLETWTIFFQSINSKRFGSRFGLRSCSFFLSDILIVSSLFITFFNQFKVVCARVLCSSFRRTLKADVCENYRDLEFWLVESHEELLL